MLQSRGIGSIRLWSVMRTWNVERIVSSLGSIADESRVCSAKSVKTCKANACESVSLGYSVMVWRVCLMDASKARRKVSDIGKTLASGRASNSRFARVQLWSATDGATDLDAGTVPLRGLAFRVRTGLRIYSPCPN
jgi:hypothetical protein